VKRTPDTLVVQTYDLFEFIRGAETKANIKIKRISEVIWAFYNSSSTILKMEKGGRGETVGGSAIAY